VFGDLFRTEALEDSGLFQIPFEPSSQKNPGYMWRAKRAFETMAKTNDVDMKLLGA
jgi:hypothetical protein